MELVLLALVFLAARSPAAAPAVQEPAAEARPAQAPDTVPPDAVPVGARLATAFEGALMDSQNGQDFAETPGYRKLLESLSDFTPEQVAERARIYLDHASALREPDRWRGEFVRLRGLIISMEAIRLRTPIRGAIDVFRGTITDANGEEGAVFDVLERPPEFDYERDVVEVEGVFYRTVRFENKRGGFREAPWLIARNVRRLDTEKLERRGPSNPLKVLVIGAALAYFGVRLITFVVQQKKQRAQRGSSGRSSIRAMMERQRGPGDESPPKSPGT